MMVPRRVNVEHLARILTEFAASPQWKVPGPGLTYATESGEVGGVAYTAYEYSTGWDLTALIATASSGFSDLERDHSLLILERIAKGLSMAHQSDPATARPWHGFLVPHNVVVSSEGEINLLGFEASPYLASLAAAGGMAEIHPYLSPELRAGGKPSIADDVYSLGALLWRLLLDEPPPPATGEGLANHLASATMKDGDVLPAGLAELLQSSLGAPPARPAHAGLWHKQLSEWMGSHQVTATHFDLAFFIHELFRRQIQSEQEEIDKEKQLDLSPQPVVTQPVATQPVATQPPAPDEGEMSDVILRPDLSGMVEAAAVSGRKQEPEAVAAAEAGTEPKSKMPLFLGLAALILVAVTAGWFLIPRGGPAEPPPPPVQARPAQARPAQATPPPPSSELQIAELELERLVQESAAAVGDQIAAEYDEQIRSLTEQLQEAQKAEAEALRSAAEAAPPSVAEPAGTPSAEPAVPPPPAEPAEATTQPESVQPESVQPESVQPESVQPEAAEPPPAEPPPAEPPPPVAPPPATPPPPQATPPPPQATARPEVKPPQRLRMPSPVYPDRARQYRKEATVLLKVLVGADGKVIDAQPVVDKPDPYGFVQAAIRAARGASFKPATRDGVPTELWTTVVVSFKL